MLLLHWSYEYRNEYDTILSYSRRTYSTRTRTVVDEASSRIIYGRKSQYLMGTVQLFANREFATDSNVPCASRCVRKCDERHKFNISCDINEKLTKEKCE